MVLEPQWESYGLLVHVLVRAEALLDCWPPGNEPDCACLDTDEGSIMKSLHLGVLMTCALAGLLLAGCGEWPPVIDTARDVAALPESQDSIRARGLADHEIPSLARLRDLRILDFSGSRAVKDARITDEGLRQLALLELPRLDTLTLGWCQGITDRGLVHLGSMHTITWLGLTDCRGITDAGLPSLTTARNLTGLDLRGCPNITDDGIQQLAAKPNWLRIWFGGCPKVTDAGVAKLQAALPGAMVDKDDAEWAKHQRY